MLTDRSGARRVAVLRQKTLARFKTTDPELFAGGAESVRVESVYECCVSPLSAITCISPCPPPFPVTVADNSANIVPQLVSDPIGYFWLLATSEYYESLPCYSGLSFSDVTPLPDGMEYRTINNNPTWDTGIFVATADIGSITFPVTITVTIISIVGLDAPPCVGATGTVTDPITFTLDAPS